jgi:hypothetical protein
VLKIQFATVMEHNAELAGESRTPIKNDATLSPHAPTRETQGLTHNDGGLTFITGGIPADFRSEKNMATVRKNVMNAYLEKLRKKSKSSVGSLKSGSVEEDHQSPPTMNTNIEGTIPRDLESPIQEENVSSRQPSIGKTHSHYVAPLVDIFGSFDELSTTEARDVYLEAERLFYDSEEDFNRAIRLFKYMAQKWDNDQRVELFRKVFEHVTIGTPLEQSAPPGEKNKKTTEIPASTGSSAAPEPSKPIPRNQPFQDPSTTGVILWDCHSMYPGLGDRCVCLGYRNNGVSSSLCICGHQASLHTSQMNSTGESAPSVPASKHLNDSFAMLGNPSQNDDGWSHFIDFDTFDQANPPVFHQVRSFNHVQSSDFQTPSSLSANSWDSGYVSNLPPSAMDSNVTRSSLNKSLHIRTESDRGKNIGNPWRDRAAQKNTIFAPSPHDQHNRMYHLR